MSTYHAVTIEWSRASEQESYSWSFDNGLVIDSRYITTPSNGIGIDPESALVAAVASSHMIAFLETCALEGIEVTTYKDRAVGFVVTNKTGHTSIDHIVLSPLVELASKRHDSYLLSMLHQKAHSNSLIAKSIISKIKVNTRFQTGEGQQTTLSKLTERLSLRSSIR